MRRAGYGVIPLLTIGILALASHLTPSPSGFGTHRELGLPPCLFQKLTGILCPSCGLTTSFTHIMHGHWNAAFHAHPLGPVFFFGMLLTSFFALLEMAGKSTPLGQFLQGRHATWAYGALTLFLLVWTGRVFWTYW